MSTDLELLTAFAEHLHANGAGVWSPNGPVVDPVLPVITLFLLPDDWSRCITLSSYVVTDPARISDVTTGLQVRTRGREGDPRDAAVTADAVLRWLHGLGGTVGLGDVRIVQCRRVSGTPLGPDQLGRHETSTNFYVDHNRVLTYTPGDG